MSIDNNLLVTNLLCVGRFHHFHLARQLEKHGLLKEIWSGFPRFALKSEEGIPSKKIHTFPWLQAPYMAKGRFGIKTSAALDLEWQWLSHTLLDKYVSKHINPTGTLIALSGSGLKSGQVTKKNGGRYFCDRGSSHIRFQDNILREEHDHWKLPYTNIDSRMVAREEEEYELADYVSVPSNFVANSFVEMGYPRETLFLNPYGARLERFYSMAEPAADEFTIIFVGQVSLRKGFLYLLEAFNRLKHSCKQLKVIGSIAENIKPLLKNYDLTKVKFLGVVNNQQLIQHYNASHVMVLPSIEEGLSMVIGEALACGCPVIASENTGASDFFTNGIEGFIIPPRSVDSLVYRLEELMNDEPLRQRMAVAAVSKVKTIGGWDTYGVRWVRRLSSAGNGTLGDIT
jgi:glycosyltransferase involved in cell wall biosynthesis